MNKQNYLGTKTMRFFLFKSFFNPLPHDVGGLENVPSAVKSQDECSCWTHTHVHNRSYRNQALCRLGLYHSLLGLPPPPPYGASKQPQAQGEGPVLYIYIYCITLANFHNGKRKSVIRESRVYMLQQNSAWPPTAMKFPPEIENNKCS